MNKMPKFLIDKIVKSHGGLIDQVKQLEQQKKANYLNQFRALSNKANDK
jgi:hypothetical protein